jgi:hypothetical protein
MQRFTSEFIEAAGPRRHAPGNRWFVQNLPCRANIRVWPLNRSFGWLTPHFGIR